jgi:hypothetical protein
VVALVTLALAILVAEERWVLAVASWYVTGSWFACALTSFRCVRTQNETRHQVVGVSRSTTAPQRSRRNRRPQHTVAAASAFDSKNVRPRHLRTASGISVRSRSSFRG